MHKPPSLSMNQIISPDAPLLSPTGPLYSPTNDSFTFNHYQFPPSPPESVGSGVTNSPIPAERVLKARTVTDEEMCISTYKLFELNEPQNPSPTSAVDQQPRPAISLKPSTAALKRSASPTPSVARKRTICSTKDFIPPDVSGLTKREARLVKNRAAAFLSRQRKREEFETMEVRVAELERENARLLALAQKGEPSSHSQPPSETELASEVEMLRAELASARKREYDLSQELATKAERPDSMVKVESIESTFPISSPSRSQTPHKSAASLGLMVLLCALPTLLSMPTQSPFPTTFSIPTALPTSASSFDPNSIFPHDFDWSRNIMDLDTDDQGRISSLPQKLEFINSEVSKSLGALGGLDISFDAVPQEDGKIRVRIHPSSSASSRAGSPGAANAVLNSDHSALGLDLWGDSENPTLQAAFSSEPSSLYNGVSSSFTSYSPSSSNGDPFLGVGGPSYNDFGGLSPFSSGSSYNSGDMDYDLGRASDYSPSLTGSESLGGSRRRVRIALKSMPATGGEGGEWEVQIC